MKRAKSVTTTTKVEPKQKLPNLQVEMQDAFNLQSAMQIDDIDIQPTSNNGVADVVANDEACWAEQGGPFTQSDATTHFWANASFGLLQRLQRVRLTPTDGPAQFQCACCRQTYSSGEPKHTDDCDLDLLLQRGVNHVVFVGFVLLVCCLCACIFVILCCGLHAAECNKASHGKASTQYEEVDAANNAPHNVHLISDRMDEPPLPGVSHYSLKHELSAESADRLSAPPSQSIPEPANWEEYASLSSLLTSFRFVCSTMRSF